MKTKYIGLIFIVLLIIAIFNYKNIPYINEQVILYKISVIKNKISKDPYSAENHYKLSQLYIKIGQLNKYEEELILLKKISPESYLYSEKLGDHYFKQNQFNKAVNEYEEAVKLNTNNENILHFKLANSYLNMENYSKALLEYENQLKLLKDDDVKNKKIIEVINEQIAAIKLNIKNKGHE
jgi:predicted Zn-dependent protease